ncbi:MAG: Hint domain-containing protein [Pseudomonadota bacterium]
MAVGPETQFSTASGTFSGLDVTLDVTLPTWTDETLPIDVDISTRGVSPDINIALVVDTSGSTSQGSGSDVDGDGNNDTYLQAQQLAAKALFQSYVDAGYDPAAVQVTLVEYATGGNTLGTFTLDQQAAFDSAVDGLNASGFTNFEAGLDQVLNTWNADSTVGPDDTNAVVFLSDGRRNRGDDGSDERDELLLDFDARITAIGVGTNSSLSDLAIIDNTPAPDGSTAQKVDDVADLIDVITAPPPLPELMQVDVFIDGVNYGTFTPGDGVLEPSPFGFRIDCAQIDGWPYTPGEEITVEVFARFDDGTSVLSGGGVLIPVTICFAEGSRLLTAEGYCPVETLCVGQEVMTRDNGLQKIRWIGSTTVGAAGLSADVDLRPVRIRAGAFGPAMPERDLRVSRQHRVLVEDWRADLLFDSETVLVPAHTLLNDDTVVVDHEANEVTYWHVVFDNHEVVTSEGLMTESFHPCRATVLGMKPAARAELVKLFPALQTETAEATAYAPAHPMLRPFEARLLLG